MIGAPRKDIPVDIGKLWRRVLSVRGEMVWVVIGQVAAASGGIVGVKLLTHWLSPNSYGQLALGLTLSTLIQQSILSPFAGASLRFFATARDSGELGSFIDAQKRILGAAVILILICLIIGMSIVALMNQREWIPIMGWCTCFSIFSSFSFTLDGMQNAARQRIVVAWHDGLGVWLRFLMGTAAVIILGARASNALAGYALASLVVFGSQYYFFNRGIRPFKTGVPDGKKVNEWRGAIISYCWPFVTWGLFVWAQSASERWALQVFGDTAQVGQYAVLFQIGYYPIMMLSGISMQLLSPMVFEIAGDGNDVDRVRRCHRFAAKLAFGTLGVTIVCAVIAHFAAALIFSLIVPSSYWPAAKFLPLMVISSGIFSAGQVLCLGPMSKTTTKLLVRPKIVTAVAAVTLNTAGAFLSGLKGVIFASLSFSLLYFVWILYLSLDISLNNKQLKWSAIEST